MTTHGTGTGKAGWGELLEAEKELTRRSDALLAVWPHARDGVGEMARLKRWSRGPR